MDAGAGPVAASLEGPYDDETAFEAVLGTDFPSHAPYGFPASLVDLYLLQLDSVQAGLGTFTRATSGIPDCDASTAGATACGPGNPTEEGEIKRLRLGVAGTPWLHLDLIALVETATGGTSTGWEINPFSHDARFTPGGVPGPATALLLLPGLAFLAGCARRARP